MKTAIYKLELITPCFCAGANPSVAEVRAPSIRGRLRWWFRILGGTAEQEGEVFGHTAGDQGRLEDLRCLRADIKEVFGHTAGDQGRASALMVRVTGLKVPRPWEPINFSGGSNTGYLLYFAKASQNGARWNSGGALPPGASFDLELTWRRPISDGVRELFDLSLEAFLLLGAIGLRSSRGLGCFEAKDKPFTEAAFQSLTRAIQAKVPKFIAGLGQFHGLQGQLFEALGAQLRGLRKGYSAGPPGRSNPTPLGSSRPRQASAVYLRPVKVRPDEFRIVVFEAPADKVLGPESRKGAPRLCDGIPSPAEAPHRGQYGSRGRHR